MIGKATNAICGLCGGAKHRVTYNASLVGGVNQRNLWLCQRCDLEPDPPVRATRGEN